MSVIKYTVEIDSNRTQKWFLNGKLHNEHGPAIVWVSGAKEWYINGQLHNENGPACETADGSKEWYINGQLHNENGPAIEDIDGTKYWYINGQQLTEEEFNNRHIKEMTISEIQSLLGHKIKIIE